MHEINWEIEEKRYQRENGLLEAKLILEEALGEVIEDRNMSVYDSIMAESALRAAIEDIEEQIPLYLRGFD